MTYNVPCQCHIEKVIGIGVYTANSNVTNYYHCLDLDFSWSHACHCKWHWRIQWSHLWPTIPQACHCHCRRDCCEDNYGQFVPDLFPSQIEHVQWPRFTRHSPMVNPRMYQRGPQQSLHIVIIMWQWLFVKWMKKERKRKWSSHSAPMLLLCFLELGALPCLCKDFSIVHHR